MQSEFWINVYVFHERAQLGAAFPSMDEANDYCREEGFCPHYRILVKVKGD